MAGDFVIYGLGKSCSCRRNDQQHGKQKNHDLFHHDTPPFFYVRYRCLHQTDPSASISRQKIARTGEDLPILSACSPSIMSDFPFFVINFDIFHFVFEYESPSMRAFVSLQNNSSLNAALNLATLRALQQSL
jgi:hypothetical protein